MSTYHERLMEKLQRRLRARTRHDGTALPGYEQNVASIRAEMEQLSIRIDDIERLRGENG